MVKGWGRRRRDEDAVCGGQKELSEAQSSPRAAVNGYESAGGRGALERKGAAPPKVKFSITLRRVKISPEKKRASYIKRLEKLISKLDKIIASPDGVEEIQLRAMEILIKAVQLCYSIISDVEVEQLEREVEDLKRREEKAEGKDRISYVVGESNPDPGGHR